MSFTLVNSNATSNNGAGASLGVAVAGVHVGDLVFVAASHNTDTGAFTCSDGTTTLTPLTQYNSSNNSVSVRGFYLLASVASGSVTYTVTFTGTPTNRTIDVYVFTPSGAASFDVENGSEVIATTAGASGNVTTTGTDALVFGAQGNENQSASSSEKINNVARTAVIDSGTGASLWYTLPSATFTGQATETIGSSTRIVTLIAAFKIPVPVITSQPTTQVVWEGQTATFNVTATGTGTLHYQWKANGSNVGTDSSSYTTAVTAFADSGTTIQVVITDNNGSTNSDTVLLIVLIAGKLMWITA